MVSFHIMRLFFPTYALSPMKLYFVNGLLSYGYMDNLLYTQCSPRLFHAGLGSQGKSRQRFGFMILFRKCYKFFLFINKLFHCKNHRVTE
jgi:hypothetical protein